MTSHDHAAPTTVALPWLVRLRWHAVGGQALAIALTNGLGVRLPVVALLASVAILALSNVVLGRLVKVASFAERAAPGSHLLGGVLLFDTIQLTTQLALSGGTENPFGVLYLVEIVIAVLVLSSRWIFAVAVTSVAAYSLLSVAYVPLAGISSRAAAGGRWAALVLAVGVVGYLGGRLSSTLRRHTATLARAQRLRARAERLASLTTLAAGAAHELGTPLGTIAIASTELETLLEGSSEDILEEARVIRDEVDRCRAIIERMSGRAGTLVGEVPEEISAAAVLAIVRHQLPPADRPRLQIEGALDAVVRCPVDSLAQALGGLVSNALQASAADKPVVVAVEADLEYARFVVRDRGVGIPKAVVSRLGEPFFTTKPPGKGMGLGIFLAQSFAELSSGSLEIDSVENEGTRVCLSMPLAGGAR